MRGIFKKWSAVCLAAMLSLSIFGGLGQTQVRAAEKETTNWMADIDGETMLSAISIPGTHDTCTQYVGLRYVRLKTRKEADREIGIAEDITTSYLERQRIEHERDFDVLTGLYNRFSFQRHMDYLFEHFEQLKIAVLVMIDLDNLKKINDAFGHDWGDNYIRQCGKCFQENVPEKTICARVSGDEFYLFLYGYDSQEEIRQRLISMTSIMQHTTVLLPNGDKMNLSASIGVSWYPQDSIYFDFLKKYADFAMYQVKKSTKGNIAEFDKSLYENEKHDRQLR